ncbi:hypothetical protein KTG15_02640 [Methanobacterium sp. YSL]|nr:hypothetical protein [Methanobacterium sp. YSL]
MRVSCEYSHLDASKILRSNFPNEDSEIYEVIDDVIGKKSKISEEKGRKGKFLYSPKVFKSEFTQNFENRGFSTLSDSNIYSVCDSNKKVKGFKKIDFFKNKVGIQVQFGKYSFMHYDLTKFQYFFNKNKIKVGIEILPSYNLHKQMSSGMGYGEQLISDLKFLKKEFPTLPIKILVIDVENKKI